MNVTVGSEHPAGHRSVPLLGEPDLGHYPHFARFFAERFDLDRNPFAPAPVVSIDGRHYELVFIGRSGRPFPAAIEIAALVAGLEPLDIDQADRDLLELIGWMLDGIGEPWTTEALHHTVRIFRIAAAEPR